MPNPWVDTVNIPLETIACKHSTQVWYIKNKRDYQSGVDEIYSESEGSTLLPDSPNEQSNDVSVDVSVGVEIDLGLP